MKIAILGWGSLLWDIENLAPHVTGDWQMQAGPRFPMEFSRISPKRKMGLAVCLDPENGEACATHAIRSTRSDVAQAVADLAARERAPLDRIGWVTGADSFGRLPEVRRIATAWLTQSDYDAAIWTDLEPVFAARLGIPFTVPAAIDYLKSLAPDQLEEAYRYIVGGSGDNGHTPLRRALAADPWWQSQAL